MQIWFLNLFSLTLTYLLPSRCEHIQKAALWLFLEWNAMKQCGVQLAKNYCHYSVFAERRYDLKVNAIHHPLVLEHRALSKSTNSIPQYFCK